MKIPKKLIKLSKADNGTLAERSLKLCEEAGEVAEATLRLIGRKRNKGETFTALSMDVVEEAIDTIVMSFDILSHMNFTSSRKIDRLLMKKLKKWEKSVKEDPRQNDSHPINRTSK